MTTKASKASHSPGTSLASADELKKLLRSAAAAPLKRLGQHFLIDLPTLESIVGVAATGQRGILVEVGPGPGILTEALAKRGYRVLAIEKDRTFARLAKERLAGYPNVRVIHDDILRVNETRLPQKPYSIVANLPYNITTPFLNRFLTKITRRPRTLVVLMQAEVAERLNAQPPRMNALAVMVQSHASPRIVRRVPPHAFWPRPAVESALVELANVAPPLKSAADQTREAQRFAAIRKAFTFPRKSMANISQRVFPDLSREQIARALQQANIKSSRRPGTLSLADWRHWFKTLTHVS